MVYTLAQGAQGYNHKLHYSLYGGVEYLPERAKFALKELLPLAAIPAVAIALLVAIVNFHVPVLSPATVGGDSSTSDNQARSVVLSAKQTGSGTSPTGSTSSSTSSTSSSIATNTSASMLAPATALTPLGNDNGQGIVVGGMGGGGGSTLPLPQETPPPTTTVPVNTPLVQADATVNTQEPQAGVDVTVPVTGTNLGTSVGL